MRLKSNSDAVAVRSALLCLRCIHYRRYGIAINVHAVTITTTSMTAPKRCLSSTWTSLVRASIVAGLKMKYMRFPRGCNGSYAGVTTARLIALPSVPAMSTSCRLGTGRSSGGFSGQAYHYDGDATKSPDLMG